MSKAIEDIKKIAFNIELNGIRCFGDEFRNIIKELERLEEIDKLQEEIGVNDLIHFLKWCVKYRTNFINRSFNSMVAFYKKAMCETEKDKGE